MLQTQEGPWGGPARVQTPENRDAPCPDTEEHEAPAPEETAGARLPCASLFYAGPQSAGRWQPTWGRGSSLLIQRQPSSRNTRR